MDNQLLKCLVCENEFGGIHSEVPDDVMTPEEKLEHWMFVIWSHYREQHIHLFASDEKMGSAPPDGNQN